MGKEVELTMNSIAIRFHPALRLAQEDPQRPKGLAWVDLKAGQGHGEAEQTMPSHFNGLQGESAVARETAAL